MKEVYFTPEDEAAVQKEIKRLEVPKEDNFYDYYPADANYIVNGFVVTKEFVEQYDDELVECTTYGDAFRKIKCYTNKRANDYVNQLLVLYGFKNADGTDGFNSFAERTHKENPDYDTLMGYCYDLWCNYTRLRKSHEDLLSDHSYLKKMLKSALDTVEGDE